MLVAGTFVLAECGSRVVAMAAALVWASTRTYRATRSCCTSPCDRRRPWCGLRCRMPGLGTFGLEWSLIFGVRSRPCCCRDRWPSSTSTLVFVVGIDLLVDMVKKGDIFRLPALPRWPIAVVWRPLVVGVGPAALHYLHSAGYQPSQA